jgi:ribosomal protein S18 acetylase RimI-like enzyme
VAPRLRPATDADREFLIGVYASTRAEELAPLPWDEATKRAFIEQQFEAQDLHYRSHYPGAALDVVEVGGDPAGRLYVHRGEHEIRIMDIALAPAFHGRGIGTGLLGSLIAEADASRRRLSIHVEQNNPARSLYDRLGFRPVGEHGVYLLLEREPGGPS